MQYTPLAPGTLVFNRYVVVGLAGQGPFGLTYLAHDQKRFDELCILKEFVPMYRDPAILEMLRQSFHQEAAALYQLQHLQLPHFRIMFTQEDRLYLVREYVVGKSYAALLSESLAAGRTFSQADVMRILVQTLPVLAYLHRTELVHQNICPDHLILRRQDQLPVLIDFALVKQLVVSLPLHPVPPDINLLQLPYAAPEQLNGDPVSPATDLYSLAATAIALLTGQEPQTRQTWWNRTQEWESQVDLHPDFARVLKRMLHPNPNKRFPSAKHVLKALEPIIAPVLSLTTPTLRSHPAPSPTPPPPSQAPIPQPVPTAASVAAAPPDPSTLYASTDPYSSPQPTPTPPSSPIPPSAPSPPSSHASRPSSHPLHARKSPPAKRQVNGDWKASAILLVSVALLVSVVSFRALSWVQKDPPPKPSPQSPTAVNPLPETSPPDPATPSPAQSMPTRETGMASPTDPRGGEVPPQFLAALTDEVFYARHPDWQGKKLGDDQPELQKEWTTLSADLQTKLISLSPETRSKLGSYQRTDYERWVAPGSGASVNERELNVLANNRFGQLFPDQKGKTLDPKTFGQVWYAIAEEELKQLKPQ